MDYMEAIKLYRETFNEGATVFGMEEEEAITRIKQAVETGKKITVGAEANALKGALI